MLEMMMGGPKPVANVGGDDLLYYYDRSVTQRAGYYGRVSADDFITATALRALLPAVSGTSINTDAGWLKFYLDGKTLFIAQKTFIRSLTWSDCFNKLSNNQLITIKGRTYRSIRLTGLNAMSSLQTETQLSMWDRLIYSVAGYAVSGQQVNGSQKWDTFSAIELGLTGDSTGGQTHCYNTWMYSGSAIYATRAYRGDITIVGGWDGNSVTSSNAGWRPVLELVE